MYTDVGKGGTTVVEERRERVNDEGDSLRLLDSGVRIISLSHSLLLFSFPTPRAPGYSRDDPYDFFLSPSGPPYFLHR